MGNRTEVDVLLQNSASNAQAWFEARNLLPTDNAATTFLEQQNWASAIHLVRATEPLIHFCVGVISDLVPDDKETVSELIHLQLGPVCMGGWVGTRSSHEADLAVGLTAKLRRWINDLRHSPGLRYEVNVRILEPPPVTSHVTIRPHAISYMVMAGLDLHAAETRDGS